MADQKRIWRLGIDVGGTNTDAVVIDGDLKLVAATKSPTTEDVMSGIVAAMHEVITQIGADEARNIGFAMLGTTHCTNAIVERKTDGMFVRGRAVVDGLAQAKGSQLIIEFQNENLIALRDGQPVTTSPDLIMSLDMESGSPVTTEGLKYGARIVVVGMPCAPQWRTPEGLAVVGPRAFGYDIDYVPVEQRVAAMNNEEVQA